MDLQIDFRKVPHRHRVDLLTDLARKRIELDHLELLLLDAMAADPEPYPGDKIACEKEWVREEVAAILRIAPSTAGKKLHVAARLTARFPILVDAMQDGLLPGYFAARLVELTDSLTDTHAAKVEARVLPRAGQQTYGQFSAAVRRAVLAVDPATAAQKHERDRHDRRVSFGPAGDNGMGELCAYLPAELMAELRARVEALAGEWRKFKDGRTIDQLRADALCALGADTTPLRPVVHVGIALSTLLGLDDKPAELDGDTVTAALARAIAFDPTGRWRNLLIDDHCHDQPRLVDVAADTYKPPAPLQRFVEVRDRTCQFLGCNRRATDCDKDHRRPWRTSHDTSAANLCCLCERHHIMKHDAGWSYQIEADRTATWTSPTNHTYQRPPPELPPF